MPLPMDCPWRNRYDVFLWNPCGSSRKPSEDWHNDYLNKRQGQDYTKLTATDLCKLGEGWITMCYAGNSGEYITLYAVILSLHLKNPENWKELFSPLHQNPTFPPDFEGDPEKSMIKCAQHDLTKYSVLLLSEEQMIEVNNLKKLQGPSFHNLIYGIKLMEVREQAAFYSFLAAITCRLICKTQGHVAAQWENKAVDAFKNFYRVSSVNFILPSPSIEALGHLKNLLTAGSSFSVSLYKAFLPVYKEACLESKQKVKRLLEFTFLQPTSMAGLGLVTYVVKAARHEEYASLEEFFEKIHTNNTEGSMGKVRDFMMRYPLALPPDPERDWWKWARNINVNSFLDLSLKSNRRLAIICMGLLATSENDDIWKAQSVKATKLEIENMMHTLKRYKKSKVYTQRSYDHFNIEEEFESLHL